LQPKFFGQHRCIKLGEIPWVLLRHDPQRRRTATNVAALGDWFVPNLNQIVEYMLGEFVARALGSMEADWMVLLSPGRHSSPNSRAAAKYASKTLPPPFARKLARIHVAGTEGGA